MSAERSIPCDDLQPWLAARALGEADDDPAFRAHLDDCTRCQADLAEYRGVAGLLPYGAPEAAPAPDLRERIVAAVAREAGAALPANPRTLPGGTAEPQLARRSGFSLSSWFALAFAALAIALLAWNVSLRAEVNNQAAEVAYHRRSWQTVIALLNDSSVRWYALAGGQASAHAWATPQGQDICFVAQALPAIADGQVLQVWVSHAGQTASLGSFEPRNGNAWVLFKSDAPFASYDQVFVTVEPNGGSAAPSGPPILSGSLATAEQPSLAERQQLLRRLADGGQRSG
jgi:anti-sigma-K factor RskA